MIRLALFFLIATLAFVGLRLILGKRAISLRQFWFIYLALLAGMLLLFLGLTGRVPWLFSLLGVALPFLARALPLVIALPQIRRLLGSLRGSSTAQPGTGQKSEIRTQFLAMELDHDTGRMDGLVLDGSMTGQRLSGLTLSDLTALLAEVAADGDSVNVLRAYLDRHHPDWDAGTANASPPPQDDSTLSVAQAYEILGLAEGATRAEVKSAHRRLMQKVHPDHGGSDYLAARINAAKAVLFDHLDAQ
ncbi:MAG: DnaJ domain-containing protein [Pseudomonadota bacterium]